MPGNIVNKPPTQVMPMGTMVSFDGTFERPAIVDEGYAYGESTRQPLTLNARRYFRVARPLTRAQADTLEQFYTSTVSAGEPFWFYDLRETVPIGSWDPTGANPVGRYCVFWDGPMARTVNLSGRPLIIEFALREVEY